MRVTLSPKFIRKGLVNRNWGELLRGFGIHSFWVQKGERQQRSLFEMNPAPDRDRFPLKVNKGTGLVIARKLDQK